MSNQAHPVEELEGSVDPRSIKYEHSKHSIKNGVFVDVIFSDVEHDELSHEAFYHRYSDSLTNVVNHCVTSCRREYLEGPQRLPDLELVTVYLDHDFVEFCEKLPLTMKLEEVMMKIVAEKTTGEPLDAEDGYFHLKIMITLDYDDEDSSEDEGFMEEN